MRIGSKCKNKVRPVIIINRKSKKIKFGKTKLNGEYFEVEKIFSIIIRHRKPKKMFFSFLVSVFTTETETKNVKTNFQNRKTRKTDYQTETKTENQ